MEVAVPEEPQKKIFRARKTMKMSDRQQLEVLHGTLTSTGSNASSPSSRPETPLVNGTHEDDGQELDKESGSKSPMSECSPPPSRSLSRSSSPAVGQNVSPSPALKDSESGEGKREKEDEKEDMRPETSKDDKTEISKSASTECELAADSKNDIKKEAASNGDLSIDTYSTGLDHVSAEEKSSKSSSSSPFGSPAASLECDPEVKEGFLCLSEEDEGQGEQDELKEEKMDVELTVKKEAEKGSKAADGTGNATPVGKKRSLSPVEMNDDCKDKDIKEERDGKRARVEGVQLEAQLELKITANAGSRLKLQKVVQQLVEERLRVLQLTVFDRSLQELKDRVDKIDATTKQQNTVQHTLQSKIARLAKKFGAANQATENSKKEPPVAAKAAPVANTTPTTHRTIRTTLDQKQLSVPPGSSSSTATPTQPKPLSTPTTPTSSALGAPAPILQIISTTTNSTPSSSSSSLSGQAQTGALLLQPRTNTGGMTNNTATTAGQPVSIQPLLIQLPLAMANGQGGAIAGGVGLIPVSSLASVSSISKAKTTTATTFILQKTSGNLVPSSSTPLSSLSSTTVTQMPQNRMVYQGGTVTASSPSAGISVSTARAPAQSAAVVGMATVSSSPATTGPAATGSAAAVNGPPSASEMASKTDNQATNLAPAKSAAQPGRPKGSVIDLTEDDDDVQGGLTVDWWEEMDKTEETEKKRHGEINDEEIDKLIVKLRHEESTVKQTTWSIRCFQTWCCEKNVSIDFKTITKTELNQILRQFYATVKNGKGESYGLSSYICLRAGLNRYINDPPLSLSWCILQDPDFTTSNSVFLGVVRKLRRESREQATHCNVITDEDFFKIKHSQALCPDTPVGLVSKVWFDLQLHLGPRGKEGNRQLKLDSIAILKDENGLKYATLTSNDITKTPKQMNDRTRESRPGFMYEQPGDPLCPISSLEKYVSLLPLNPPAFYLHPKKTIGTNDTWYTREPIGVNFLASMLPRICRAAGIKPVYTNHCLQSTTVQKLMLAWKQGKLCLSGHQMTSVQKAAAAAAAASANPTTTPRAQGPTPSLVSSTSVARPLVQHRPTVDSPSKSRSGSTSGSTLPPLPIAPPPPIRLPVEAAHTSPPQQPQLKLARVQSQNGIVLSWCVSETERSCAPVDSYHLYAYHQDQQAAAVTPSTQSSSHSLWKKIGEVKALPLPMACTLTQFVSGSTYYFAVRAKDVYGRFGPFCEPQCTDVINPPTSSAS